MSFFHSINKGSQIGYVIIAVYPPLPLHFFIPFTPIPSLTSILTLYISLSPTFSPVPQWDIGRCRLYNYNMRCEHGEKITKFCVTEHCHHREAAGCDYCIKKSHFHLTNTTLLTEPELEAIIKTLTTPSEAKYKSRALQELATDYLRQLKQALSSWFEQAQTMISDRLTHPLLRKQGLLTTYQRIRGREYRKLVAKDLRVINDFAKNTQPESFKKEEIHTYFSEVEWTASIIDAAESFAKELAKLPILKDVEPIATPQRSAKLNETFESVLRERDRYQSQLRQSEKQAQLLKPEGNRLEEVMKSSSLMKNRLNRELSVKEKSSTPSKDIVGDILSKKLTTVQPSPRIGSTIPVTLDEPKVQQEKPNEGKEEKAKRLRRRRSSIDEGMNDLKFNQQQREKDIKQLQLRKKNILQTVFSSKESEKQQKQSLQKQQKQETKLEPIAILPIPNVQVKQPVQAKRGNSGQKQKQAQDNRSQISSKGSNGNIFESLFQKGINMAQLINSVIPAPPLARPHNEHQVVTNKVVKIPIGDKQHIDQIQSPIFKNKRKMDMQHHKAGGGFGITLNPVEQKQDQLPLPSVKEEMKEETESFIPNAKPPTKPAEEDVIVLESSETNSLCLFGEALKSSSEKAIELLKAALRQSPENLSAAEYLSYLYLQGGRAKECLQVCESILLKIQDKAQQFQVTLHLHNNRAAALNMLGRYSQSIVVLQKCLKYRRKHYFYKNLADAYFSLGIPEKAAMNYEKAIRLDPGYDEAFYNLAVTQFIQEEYTSCKLNIDQALKIDANNQQYRELEKEVAKRIENIMR